MRFQQRAGEKPCLGLAETSRRWKEDVDMAKDMGYWPRWLQQWNLKKEDHRSLLDCHGEARGEPGNEPLNWRLKSWARVPLSLVGVWSGCDEITIGRIDQWFLNLVEHPTHLEGTLEIQIPRPQVGPSESTLQWLVGLGNWVFIGGSDEARPQISIREPHVGNERWDLGYTGRGNRAEEFPWQFFFSPFNFVFRIEETWALFPGHGWR